MVSDRRGLGRTPVEGNALLVKNSELTEDSVFLISLDNKSDCGFAGTAFGGNIPNNGDVFEVLKPENLCSQVKVAWTQSLVYNVHMMGFSRIPN